MSHRPTKLLALLLLILASHSAWAQPGARPPLFQITGAMLSSPCVLREPHQWVLYFSHTVPRAGISRIGRAISTNGIDWNFTGDCIEAEWPSQEAVSVVLDEQEARPERRYKMYFQRRGSGQQKLISVAFSPNGVVFRTFSSPVSSIPGTSPCVTKAFGRYNMFYTQEGDIRQATSLDGIIWSQPLSITKGGSPRALWDGSRLQLWYQPHDRFSEIRAAVCQDGKHWNMFRSAPSAPQADPNFAIVAVESEYRVYYASTRDPSNSTINLHSFATRPYIQGQQGAPIETRPVPMEIDPEDEKGLDQLRSQLAGGKGGFGQGLEGIPHDALARPGLGRMMLKVLETALTREDTLRAIRACSEYYSSLPGQVSSRRQLSGGFHFEQPVPDLDYHRLTARMLAHSDPAIVELAISLAPACLRQDNREVLHLLQKCYDANPRGNVRPRIQSAVTCSESLTPEVAEFLARGLREPDINIVNSILFGIRTRLLFASSWNANTLRIIRPAIVESGIRFRKQRIALQEIPALSLATPISDNAEFMDRMVRLLEGDQVPEIYCALEAISQHQHSKALPAVAKLLGDKRRVEESGYPALPLKHFALLTLARLSTRLPQAQPFDYLFQNLADQRLLSLPAAEQWQSLAKEEARARLWLEKNRI